MIIKKKERKKRSLIWTISKEELKKIVKESNTIAEILKKLGYGPTGRTHEMLQKRIKQDDINFNHIKLGTSSNKGRNFNFNLSLEESKIHVFNNTNTYKGTDTIKKYILLYNFLKYECSECKNLGTWNNQKLVLQLDHINGIRTDNRLENLRFLCPNCHSQTGTYGAKNHKKQDN